MDNSINLWTQYLWTTWRWITSLQVLLKVERTSPRATDNKTWWLYSDCIPDVIVCWKKRDKLYLYVTIVRDMWWWSIATNNRWLLLLVADENVLFLWETDVTLLDVDVNLYQSRKRFPIIIGNFVIDMSCRLLLIPNDIRNKQNNYTQSFSQSFLKKRT